MPFFLGLKYGGSSETAPKRLLEITTREYVFVNNKWIFLTDDVLSKEEQKELNNEISDLKRKIKLYKKMAARL